MSKRTWIEVVCTDLDQCLAAQDAGADRIELCDQIELGGLTPDPKLIEQVRQRCSLSVVAMIRPRAGDFVYSETEAKSMERQGLELVCAGADALVLGTLSPAHNIDIRRCSDLLAMFPVPCVFHRAIDLTSDILASARQLEEIGFTRVLSSGGAETALEGATNLYVMGRGSNLEVLPGGGIRSHNVQRVVELTGANQIHLAPFRDHEQDGLQRGIAEIRAIRAKLTA